MVWVALLTPSLPPQVSVPLPFAGSCRTDSQKSLRSLTAFIEPCLALRKHRGKEAIWDAAVLIMQFHVNPLFPCQASCEWKRGGPTQGLLFLEACNMQRGDMEGLRKHWWAVLGVSTDKTKALRLLMSARVLRQASFYHCHLGWVGRPPCNRAESSVGQRGSASQRHLHLWGANCTWIQELTSVLKVSSASWLVPAASLQRSWGVNLKLFLCWQSPTLPRVPPCCHNGQSSCG